MSGGTSGKPRPRLVALVGNPNSGKSSIFNALTRLRQRVGNYPGVTVERKEGRLTLDDGSVVILLDLPGMYSLSPASLDERIAVGVVLGTRPYGPAPDAVLCVVDASNLERNLYLASQIIDRGLPVIIALNMLDVARQRGIVVHTDTLSHQLGVPVIATNGKVGSGTTDLRRALCSLPAEVSHVRRRWKLPEPVEEECEELSVMLKARHHLTDGVAFHEALSLLTSSAALPVSVDRFAPEIMAHLRKDHEKLDFLGIDRQSVAVNSRYAWIQQVVQQSVDRVPHPGMSRSDRIDTILTHRVWGVAIFLGIMAVMFQAIFSWAAIPMALIGGGFDWVGQQLAVLLPRGDVRDLVINGGLAGVAAVVTFLPQILFLFFFLGILEDSGYMARAAFVMDRLMGRVGLHGKSFIPLLSSFACAIPGIMAARTIENDKDRLVTILVAPLMSCSARLPVYTLLIGAFIPGVVIFGIVSLPAVTLLGLYLFGLAAALAIAWLFKKTFLKSAVTELLIELPSYRLPSLRHILHNVWDRAWLFLKNAGTIILGASIVLWFLATYPRMDGVTTSGQLEASFAGQAGRLIEPVIAPLGFNWKIGIGLVSSLLQREVFVSTMGTIYNIQNGDQEASTLSLQEHMRTDHDPVTGAATFTTLTAVCLMVYYVLAMQCISTVAVVRRETNSWKWPLFQIGYMTLLAYGMTLAVRTTGVWLGWG